MPCTTLVRKQSAEVVGHRCVFPAHSECSIEDVRDDMEWSDGRTRARTSVSDAFLLCKCISNYVTCLHAWPSIIIILYCHSDHSIDSALRLFHYQQNIANLVHLLCG